MVRFHKLFEQRSEVLLKRAGITEELPHPALTWYPSAEDDLRHIAFLEFERLFAKRPRSSYLHLMNSCLFEEQLHDEGTPFLVGQRINLSNGTALTVESSEELYLKHPLCDPSSDIWGFDQNQFSNKVHLLLFCIEKTILRRRVAITAPGIYFQSENLDFLVNFLIANRLFVTTLIHIKDGGASFGGSKIPMNFIYLTQGFLKFTRVISDHPIARKYIDDESQIEALHKQLRSSERPLPRRLYEERRFPDPNPWDLGSSIETENLIPFSEYGKNTYSFLEVGGLFDTRIHVSDEMPEGYRRPRWY